MSIIELFPQMDLQSREYNEIPPLDRFRVENKMESYPQIGSEYREYNETRPIDKFRVKNKMETYPQIQGVPENMRHSDIFIYAPLQIPEVKDLIEFIKHHTIFSHICFH